VGRKGLVGVGLICLATASLGQRCWAQSAPLSPKTDSQSMKNPPDWKNRIRLWETDGDDSNDPSVQSTARDNSLARLPIHILMDQKALWTSPAKIRTGHLPWLVPFAGITAGLITTDRDVSGHLSNVHHTLKRYDDISNYGIYGMAGVSGGLFLLGKMTNNDHQREAGLLAGEAAVDSLAVVTALKYATGRKRPLQDNGRGRFWQGGDSFPSDHAALAWSMASVLAHEYPGFLPQVLAYGTAAAISASRVQAKQHFPSEALLGSGIGWLIGWQVYRAHHDSETGGGGWEGLSAAPFRATDRQPGDMGSPYVPLDSWVYPAFDRLIALGYVKSAIVGLRPWTRLECARLLSEAADRLEADATEGTVPERFIASLQEEFAKELAQLGGAENRGLELESLYTRVTEISGRPLTDGYHFGQTVVNDFGRPVAQGFNTIDGFSGWASEGPFTAYVRGEFQHAPFDPPLSAQARIAVANADRLPVPPPASIPAVDQFQLLDAYVAMNVKNWQLSFGQQSLWWGPSKGGPLTFSDNAVPFLMFKIDRVSPFTLPGFLRWLGPIRSQFFLGQLSGHEFVFVKPGGVVGQWGRSLNPQPFFDGGKLSLKPFPNFEFGIDYTVMVGGPGQPFTFHKFLQTLPFVFPVGNGETGTKFDAGDADSAADFSYRFPGNWLTLYGDLLTEDEISPLNQTQKSAIQAGIYMPRIPFLPKLDLRVEGGETDPTNFPFCQGCFYFNTRFRNGSTNGGNLMGSWIGRDGKGGQAWATYWLSPRNTIQVRYRHQKVSGAFIQQGGTVNDGEVRADFWVGTQLKLSGSVQYEKWKFPVLDPSARSNVTTSIEMSFWPHGWGLHAQ
jgi:Capsule assembly protein Wzi/PAP2 superfamily